MKASQSPAAFVAPFANAAGVGFIRTIPATSQIGITDGAASLHDGYPPKCFSPVAAGGVPPFGQDTNGILYQTTAGVQWQQVGGQPVYNSTFSTAIGGYPNGAILQSADGTGFWRSLADNNTSNPDTGGANWLPMFFGTAAAIGLTNANVTLSAVQYSKPIIVLTGTLTGNVALTFPAFVQEWDVVNATSGAYAVTALVSGGIPVTLSQGGKTTLRGDGTNVYIDALQVAPATQPQHAMQLGQATGRLLNIQTFTSSSTYTPTAGTKNCRVTVVGGGASGGGAAATLSGQIGVGGGGGGGALAIGYYPVAALSGQAVTIGAGGNAASGNGNAGGTSSIGAVMSANGGVGGSAGVAATPPTVAAPGAGGTTSSGGNITGGLGGSGAPGIGMAVGNIFSGNGGGSIYSLGVSGTNLANNAGNNGSGPGCGGSGATSSNGGSAQASGSGFKGIVVIEEFA